MTNTRKLHITVTVTESFVLRPYWESEGASKKQKLDKTRALAPTGEYKKTIRAMRP